METVEKQPDSWDLWKDANSLKQGVYGKSVFLGHLWHALMHRREPDASNSKYWFRRVGAHPVIAQLVEQASALGYDYTNPFDFVDFCEQVRGMNPAEEETARRVQDLEWRLLFDHCYRLAAAG